MKYNHPISFSFASYNDYNIQIIKKFLFFFSFCLDFTINALFFTDETIHKIYEDKGNFNFLYFFILDFIVLIFLSYYIACFCGIYVNTQIHLIKDSLISLITSLLVPFVLCLIPGILRISSLRVKKPNKKLLYKFSIFIENWLC